MTTKKAKMAHELAASALAATSVAIDRVAAVLTDIQKSKGDPFVIAQWTAQATDALNLAHGTHTAVQTLHDALAPEKLKK